MDSHVTGDVAFTTTESCANYQWCEEEHLANGGPENPTLWVGTSESSSS